MGRARHGARSANCDLWILLDLSRQSLTRATFRFEDCDTRILIGQESSKDLDLGRNAEGGGVGPYPGGALPLGR